MVRLMEYLPSPNDDSIVIPYAVLVRHTVVIMLDSVLDTLTMVTPVRPAKGVPAEAALARAVDRLTAVVDALDRPLAKEPAGSGAEGLKIAPASNTPAAGFRAMVGRAKEKIVARGIFQLVIVQGFQAPLKLSPLR